MKVHAQEFDTNVTALNCGETTQFTIDMNEKAFRLLSSTLYSNKIGSIVREVSTNARDSHIAAGKNDLPIEIHMPDALEPYFSVRDFGTGMSDSTIRNVMSSYFKSTKDQSNNEAGGFGLGSKTPFAYTDSFTIESKFDGMCIVYSAIIMNGLPQLTELTRYPVDVSETGVVITVPVDSSGDYNSFRNEVLTQLQFFTPSPRLLNYTEETIPAPIKVILVEEPGDFVVGTQTGFGKSNRLRVIVGGVSYPVENDYLQPVSRKAKVLFDYCGSNNSMVAINFGIGDLDITMSRESLEYTKRTVKALSDKLESVYDAIAKKVVITFDGCKTDYERQEAYMKFGQLDSGLLGFIDRETFYKSGLVFQRFYSYYLRWLTREDKTPSVGYKTREIDGVLVPEHCISKSAAVVLSLTRYSARGRNSMHIRVSHYTGDSIEFNLKSKYLIDDCGMFKSNLPESKLHAKLQHNWSSIDSTHRVYGIVPDGIDATAQNVVDFLTEVGVPADYIIYTSNLEEVPVKPKAPRAPRSTPYKKIYKMFKVNQDLTISEIQEMTIDEEKTYYYKILPKGGRVEHINKAIASSALAHLNYLAGKGEEVLIIRESIKDKSILPNFVSVEDHRISFIRALCDGPVGEAFTENLKQMFHNNLCVEHVKSTGLTVSPIMSSTKVLSLFNSVIIGDVKGQTFGTDIFHKTNEDNVGDAYQIGLLRSHINLSDQQRQAVRDNMGDAFDKINKILGWVLGDNILLELLDYTYNYELDISISGLNCVLTKPSLDMVNQYLTYRDFYLAAQSDNGA